MGKIKVGYVSPDFRIHSVSQFFKPLLLAHNRDEFEIYCYSNVARPDSITTYIKSISDHWRNILGVNDKDVVQLIKKDEINILVDLSGHTANNRLKVFTHKPAPVQVTWLGYPNTTGLSTMDYRFTDSIADPPGSDHLYTEKLIRLKDGFLCYSGDESIKASTSPPCLKNGYITFGSFNNLPKVTAEVISLWSRILRSLFTSRLILKARQLKDKGVRSRIRKLFKKNGISFKRVQLFPMLLEARDHLNFYSRIDIALDTFPYNGTTTTCEALWMGVPVVTLKGSRHAGRVGASILTHANLKELIAENTDQYMEIVLRMGNVVSRLWHRKRNLIRTSSLCNSALFAKNMETAYKEIYGKYTELSSSV